MLNADELAELRALQRRAYGPDGGASSAELARLQELEALRRGGAADGDVPGDGALRQAQGPSGVEQESSEVEQGPSASEQGADVAEAAPTASVLRRLANPLTLIAVAVALVAGLGVGWAIFGIERSAPLTADQQLRVAELYDEWNFDPGSVQLITWDDEAEVWTGTTKGAESLCVVLDVGSESGSSCDSVEALENGGLSASVQSGESREHVSTWLMAGREGELFATLQRWEMESDAQSWVNQFDEEVRPRVQELLDEGYLQYNIEMIGRFLDEPVWAAQKATGEEICLIVDADAWTSCGDSATVQRDGLTANIIRQDEATGRDTTWRLELSYAAYRPYFTAMSESIYTFETSDPIEFDETQG